MVLNLKAAHFNTIFFQVRARGDAYYRSSYEPWAQNLTGVLGKDPGWDPLSFLLREAHSEGMEVHAWFNLYKIRGQNPVGPSSPEHPTRSHPRWTVQMDGESWLDPGLPEVRAYLLNVSLELVRRYEIDGILFDFIRYPGREFPDVRTYRRYGKGMSRDDWRRANINRFVDEFYVAATALKPLLKVGSAPLGIYNGINEGETSGSYHSYFQDSQGWLRSGKHDYLAPQVYWNIGASPGDPDFAFLVRKWRQGAAERQVYIGIGAYKAEVLREIPAQIDTTRANGLSGQAYFRYGNISNFAVLGNRYHTLAAIPPMQWKDSVPPLPPARLAISEITHDLFRLDWSAPPQARDGDRAHLYSIYRSASPEIRYDDPATLVAIIGAERHYYMDTIRTPGGLTYYYAVTALDRANNESAPSPVAIGIIKEVAAMREKISDITALAVLPVAGGEGPNLVAYSLAERMTVSLDIYETNPDGSEQLLSALFGGEQEKGRYVVGLGGVNLTSGVYILRLKAGDTTLQQMLALPR